MVRENGSLSWAGDLTSRPGKGSAGLTAPLPQALQAAEGGGHGPGGAAVGRSRGAQPSSELPSAKWLGAFEAQLSPEVRL